MKTKPEALSDQERLVNGLQAALDAARELIRCDGIDNLFYQAVELARERLGVERCGIFLERGGEAWGTYGTDMRGATSDEHNNVITRKTDRFSLQPTDPHWQLIEDHEHSEWDGTRMQVRGEGWVVRTPILSSDDTILGMISNDAAISRAPLDPVLQQVLTVYASILGAIYESKKAQEALAHRVELDNVITSISAAFINLASGDIDAGIHDALERLGLVAQADRSYVFLFHDHQQRATNTHEWCNDGITPVIETLQNIPVDSLPWIFGQLLDRKTVYVQRTSELPEEAAAEKAEFERENILSLICLPICRPGHVLGFIGFDAVHTEMTWPPETVAMMRVVGEILASVFDRKHAAEREQDLQNRLARARRMESLGILAGGIAHDLNNILGPLVAYPDLILQVVPDNSPVRDDILEMQRSAERAAAVVRDLLSMGRRGTIESEPVDLNAVITSYLHSAAFRDFSEPYPDVQVDPRLHPDAMIVLGSIPHLTQVLMNLVNNALESMPHGGRLTIETFPETGIDASGPDDPFPGSGDVVLRVTDTGGGIEDAHIEHIFEPFYTRKKMGRSGTGLGLAVVYGIVQDLDGQIDVQTAIGKGTSFTVRLPATKEASRGPEHAEVEIGGNERVLVVDDAPEQRELAIRVLSGLGYDVDAVSSGHEALDYLRERQMDLLVLDMIMGDDLDGLDTYRRVLEINPLQRCIIASGFAETDRVKQTLALGAGGFVHKPYTQEGLGRAVRREIDRTH